MSENTIKIVLPVFEKDLNLTEDERKIYQILSKTMLKPISEIVPYVEFGKSKTTQLLKIYDEKRCCNSGRQGKRNEIYFEIDTKTPAVDRYA